MKGNWKKKVPSLSNEHIDWSIAKIEACVFAIRINGDGTIQNLHWKLGQQTPSVGTLLVYLETTA